MESIIEFRVKVKTPDDFVDAAEVVSEVGEALKDYLYDANNSRPYETDPEIIDVTYQVYVGVSAPKDNAVTTKMDTNA